MLTGWGGWIGPARDTRRIEVHPLDRAGSGQGRSAHCLDIEPLVRRALEGTIIEVKSVDIDDGARHEPSRNAEGRPGFCPNGL